MQEWLEGWLESRDVDFVPNPNSQMPPNIFLDSDNLTHNLLEVKAFNREGSPGFDIADFKAFVNELIEKPYHIDTDFIIFGYIMDEETGDVIVKDLWLKKIWEITRRMENYPINLQVKEGVIHKIRPGVWYSERLTDYAIFECLEDFVSAIEETTFKEPKLRNTIASTWLTKFQKNYKAWHGRELNVPRWNDIKDKYDLITDKKREKAKERLLATTAQKEKIEARVLKYQQAIIKAKTNKQKEKAEVGLAKAMKTLESPLKKVADAQAQYDIWINQ